MANCDSGVEAMNKFKDLIKLYAKERIENPKQFPKLGETYLINEENIKGYYWFYETDDFIFDINDLTMLDDVVYKDVPDIFNFFYISSIYIISASGETFYPYQVVEPKTLYIIDRTKPVMKYVLHKNSKYSAVSLKIKESFLDDEFFKRNNLNKTKIASIFVENKGKVSKKIEKIAMEILKCKLDAEDAKLFFEKKAKEWIAISLSAIADEKDNVKLPQDDDRAITSVAKYIEDHFSMNLKEDLLSKIAMMSPTKLKYTFKKKYGVSITEFTQRKRMNVAENLILTTDLDAKSIAKSVGYASQSRFSTLYKRYKGCLPSQLMKIKN